MLTFDTLRAANVARLPQFKNSQGGAAHAKPDGSDWCPAQWLQALVGEVGEFARVRLQYETGEIAYDHYCELAAKELADIATYLDLLALRSLDKLMSARGDESCIELMKLLAALGEYANSIKKYERGDIGFAEHETLARVRLTEVRGHAFNLNPDNYTPPSTIKTVAVSPGINLGAAAVSKFNEVSARVGSDITIEPITRYGLYFPFRSDHGGERVPL